MECPICKNKQGFACGTCIDCGYNHISNTYEFIEVRTDTLKQIVSPEVYNWLVAEHEKWKYRKESY